MTLGCRLRAFGASASLAEARVVFRRAKAGSPSRYVITVRRAGERLRTRIGWLDSRYTFSFEEHIDPGTWGFAHCEVWAQVVRGSVQLNGVALTGRDGACTSDEAALEVQSSSVSETLLFDLA